MTKREKTIRDLRNKIARMEAQREAAIKTLVRVETTLPKLGNQLRRLTARDRKLMEKEVALGYQITRKAAEKAEPVDQEGDGKAGEREPEPDLGIPEFLRRGMAAQKAVNRAVAAGHAADPLIPEVREAAHAVANAHNKAPTEEQKKLVAQEKRKVKEEHRHANLTGAKRKWPATGKAAANLLK